MMKRMMLASIETVVELFCVVSALFIMHHLLYSINLSFIHWLQPKTSLLMRFELIVLYIFRLLFCHIF